MSEIPTPISDAELAEITKITPETDKGRTAPVIRALAKSFVERAGALSYKGKARDNAALDYFVGAATLARETGDNALCQHLGVVCAMSIAVRGYIGVAEIAAQPDPAPEPIKPRRGDITADGERVVDVYADGSMVVASPLEPAEIEAALAKGGRRLPAEG